MATELNDLRSRVQALEDFVLNTKLPVAESGAERSISRVIIDMENYVRTLVEDPPVKVSGLKISMNSELGAIMDEKLTTAMSFTKGTPSTLAWWKSVLGSKAIQEIGPVVDSKQYRQWSKKTKNAPEQMRPSSRQAFDFIEKLIEDEVNDAGINGISDSRKDMIFTHSK